GLCGRDRAAGELALSVALCSRSQIANAAEGEALSGAIRAQWPEPREDVARVRRCYHRSLLRLSRRCGLLRAGKRDAGGAPDCRSDAHPYIEGRSGGSLRIFWRSRNRWKSQDSSYGHGIWRTLRFYIADERSRALLGGGAGAGLLHCARAGINL